MGYDMLLHSLSIRITYFTLMYRVAMAQEMLRRVNWDLWLL